MYSYFSEHRAIDHYYVQSSSSLIANPKGPQTLTKRITNPDQTNLIVYKLTASLFRIAYFIHG